MGQCSCKEANWAVIGRGPTRGNWSEFFLNSRGVLFWHTHYIGAIQDTAKINLDGGSCQVVETPGGHIGPIADKLIKSLLFGGQL